MGNFAEIGRKKLDSSADFYDPPSFCELQRVNPQAGPPHKRRVNLRAKRADSENANFSQVQNISLKKSFIASQERISACLL